MALDVARPTAGRSPSSPHPRAVLIATSLGMAVVQLDVFVVNVGVKAIGAALGGGTSALQWVVGAYTLLLAALILTAGALADRFGARRMALIGFVVFISASIGCGLAPDIGVLVGFRAVQGAGAALLGSCTLTILNHTFHDGRSRARAVGVWAAGATLALTAGPVVGGALIAGIGWRAIFFINVPVGLVALVLTARYVAETERSEHPVDVPGQITAVLAMAALAEGLIEGGTRGWSDPLVVASLALGALSAVAFGLVEARVAHPMLPRVLFRRGTFSRIITLGFLLNVGCYGLIFVLSLYYQQELGYSALKAGLAFVPLTGGILAANLLCGPLLDAIGVRAMILTGLAAVAAGCAGLLVVSATSSYGDIVAQQVLFGAGMGLIVPPMTSTLMGTVERSRSGIASGTLTSCRQAGSVLGVAVFGSLIAGGGHFVHGFHLALCISIGLVVLGAALAVRLRPEHVIGRLEDV